MTRRRERAPRRKHGLSFEEAKQLFVYGIDYYEIPDEFHSNREERFIAIGPISRGIVLVVWTERSENTIRIISARFATRREQELYQRHLEGLI
ncbi:MAG: BrnT family toxin [Proteobacteria bacterium]|nr:BrnT family toxin [Pseudomonadota bacterium]